jgi:hypothetical protein
LKQSNDHLWYNSYLMEKAKHIKIPVIISIQQVSNNTIIHQRRKIFTLDKTDEIVTVIEAVASRSGKPVADILHQFSLDTVKDKLEKDVELQKIINNFENQFKSKLRVEISLDGSISW